MEEFEAKAISSGSIHPGSDLDNTFVIQKAEYSHQFLQHIDPVDLYIMFIIENPKDDGSTSFLDTLVSSGPNNTLITSVYRKPTHTDQSLYWNSSINLWAKYITYNILSHRARVVGFSQPGIKQEEDHIRQTLLRLIIPHVLHLVIVY